MSGRLDKKNRALTTVGARRNAIKGDEKMTIRYYMSRTADYIDTTDGFDGVPCRRQYFEDEDSHYCFIDSDNFKRGARLPIVGDELELIERDDLYVNKSAVVADKTEKYYVVGASYNVDGRVAKLTLGQIS